MKVTIKQLLEANAALEELSKMKLPADIAWSIATIKVDGGPHIQKYHEARNNALHSMGTELPEKPGMFIIEDSEQSKEFFGMVAEWEAEEVELDLVKIPFTLLQSKEVTPDALLGLRWLIDRGVK